MAGSHTLIEGTIRGTATSGCEDMVTIRVVNIGWNDKWNML